MGRHRRSIAGVATAIVTALALLVVPSGRPAPPAGPADEVQRALTAVLEGGAPGVVAAVRDDVRGSWSEAKGFAVVGTAALPGSHAALSGLGVPMEPRNRFRVASISKTFVATLILQLAGEGRLDLDAPLARYLPGLLQDADRITVRQLLNHTSGLPDPMGTPALDAAAQAGAVLPPTELVRIADGLPRQFAPGSRYAYSNTNYQALGLLVERLTGQPLGQVLADRLVRPLGLTATSFEPDPASATWPGTGADVAHGYLSGGLAPDGAPVDATGNLHGGAWAAGGVVSTVADLTRFYAALLSGRLLDRAMLRQMTTAVPHPPDGLPTGEDGYGLGLAHLSLPCGTAWGHGGNLGEYFGMALAAPDGHRAVAVLVNGSTGARGVPDLIDVITAMARAAQLAFCQPT